MRAFAACLAILALVACVEDGIRFPRVTHAETRGLCGTCHMAFQPSMLPAASWDRMMAGLGDHFGDKVTLPPGAGERIGSYLAANAGDANGVFVGPTALAGLAEGAAPLRITETPYWREEHESILTRVLPVWVGTNAHCVACHVDANSGDYSDG